VKKEELLALQRVEEDHWFYKGKRELVLHWLEKLGYKEGSYVKVLDAGAGTGILVRELKKRFGAVAVTGVEYSPDAREIAKEVYSLDLTPGSILELPIADSSMDVSIALDVLEHVERDDTALSELLRVTKKGGALILNVPAMPSLWSDWDVALGHFRRYTNETWLKLLQQDLASGRIEIVSFAYINALAFPAIYAYRTFRKLRPSTDRAEDKVPGPLLNTLMKSSFVVPAKWTWFKPPFGVSIFCVLRKLKD
jgi:ubiquinone/menaquinone biosynthesis C-methylase UbiE